MNSLNGKFFVGVFISVYSQDTLRCFQRAINSVLDQDCKDSVGIRIYLGIDGPVDRYVDDYIDQNSKIFYKIYRSPINIGLAAILNHLILLREDELFYFRMDSDDYSLPTRFRRQLEFMDTHQDVDVLGTDIIEVHDNFERVIAYPSADSDFSKCICKGTLVAHPTVCFRASVFDRVGLYPDIRGNEDIAMWFKCIEHGVYFSNLHESLLRFTVSKNFWNRRSYAKAMSEFKVYFSGIYRLHGISFFHIYPILRLLIRISPSFVSIVLYRFRKFIR